MKYVLMFVDTEEYEKELAAMTGDERAEAVRQVEKWFADHAGKARMGGKLQPAHTATTVRLPRGGGEPMITDGPFVEGKEVVSGFCEIDVEDLDEALRMVRSWPACPTVEIRPVETMPAGR
ncbi:YciI family protein [Nonomuraea sp. CA-141351]|uniref:YciI family protein n=1 Tax=Nonomuraea sp. CA-141351 TaxID=3239996 RepID=UPI003D9448CF